MAFKTYLQYIILFCLINGQQGLFAQDIWKIRASDIDGKNYYGVTIANGMIGIVSSPKILETGTVILAGAYDKYGRGGVNNFIPAFNLLNLNLQIDGEVVKQSDVTSFVQVLDMKTAELRVSFKYEDKAVITCDYYALRQLPFAVLANYKITALRDISIKVSHQPATPGSLIDVNYVFAKIPDKENSIDLLTASAKSPNAKFTICASTSFVFDKRQKAQPEVKAVKTGDKNLNAEFSCNILQNTDFHFALVGGLISSEQHPDPFNEVQRITIFAALQGVNNLISDHVAEWNRLWKSDITITGDNQSQQDIHNMLYHLYSFVRADSHYSLSPMGLSGLGYNGHIFWDADVWMLPVFLILHPEMARSMLEYRYERLKAAEFNAYEHGFKGAMYPWESSDSGNEDTPVWALTGPYEHHISACVALAAWNYYCVTGDRKWLKSEGWPIISKTADFWLSRVKKQRSGKYSINNVVASDEWAENVDDDAFTNGAAITNLRLAVKASKILGLHANPAWASVASGIQILKMKNGVTSEHATYHGEPIKQADVNLLAYPLSIITDTMCIHRDLKFYETRVPDKETPAMTYSIFSLLYARLGDAAKAYHFFKESYEPNLDTPFRVIAENKGGDNPYFATGAGGVIQSVLMGFGGLQINSTGIIHQKSVLPAHWKSLKITGVGKDRRTYIISR